MNATAINGDEWTGEIITEGFEKFYLYKDSNGFIYESKEAPAYRIDFLNCTQIKVDGKMVIIPITKLQNANISTRD